VLVLIMGFAMVRVPLAMPDVPKTPPQSAIM
jgi:hypothetical protein